MLYTTEEAAVICGFLNAHLAQAGVEASVRKRNAAFQRGVIMGTLQPDDYRWAENVLCFLRPCWWQLHEDYRALENVLLRRDLSRGVSPKFIKSCNPGTFLNLDSTVLGTYWMKAQPPFVSVGSCAYAIIT